MHKNCTIIPDSETHSDRLKLGSDSLRQIFILAGRNGVPNYALVHLRSLGVRYSVFRSFSEIAEVYTGVSAASLLVILDAPEIIESSRSIQSSSILQFRRKIEEFFWPLPILVLPYKTDSLLQIMEGLRNGAMDYLLPGQSPRQWGGAITRTLNWSEDNLERLSRQSQIWKRYSALSDELKDAAKMLFNGLSNQEMAAASGKSLRTIENRRAVLFKSMEAGSLAELIRFLGTIEEIQQRLSNAAR